MRGLKKILAVSGARDAHEKMQAAPSLRLRKLNLLDSQFNVNSHLTAKKSRNFLTDSGLEDRSVVLLWFLDVSGGAIMMFTVSKIVQPTVGYLRIPFVLYLVHLERGLQTCSYSIVGLSQ